MRKSGSDRYFRFCLYWFVVSLSELSYPELPSLGPLLPGFGALQKDQALKKKMGHSFRSGYHGICFIYDIGNLLFTNQSMQVPN